ncbi:NAD(P)-dependent alcohol dehydrogenase [Chitinimonas sp.]|uniref:zinc-dependent alcohol dehydrogenase family protein n=1 Tax=Chitinimonas sp. TaxID=1934313 RepID=UPI002F95AF74
MLQIELKQFGLEHLVATDAPVPVAGPGEVLVRLRARSLNYRDRVVIDGSYMPNLALPFVPVADATGEVVDVGPGVGRFGGGERVLTHYTTAWLAGRMRAEYQQSKLGGPLQGMLREYAVLPEQALLPVPEHLSLGEAATLPIAALTAWNALQESQLQAGDTVLVQGTGSVSLFALQFAKLMGCRVIITSSSEAKLARARALGADTGINYLTEPAWGKVARELSTGGVDAVIEVGGMRTLAQSMQAVRAAGTVAVIGFLGGVAGAGEGPDITRALVASRARLQGISVGHRESFEAMNRAIALHGLRPVIDSEFALPDYAAAFARFASGDAFGKVLITG